MSHPFVYVGCFIKFDTFQSVIKAIRKNPLKNDIKAPHVTFKYRPSDVDDILFGESVRITIIGYGNDGLNEGLKVALKADNLVIQHMIDKIEIPHITVAVSNEGKPVNTKYLRFEKIKPIEIDGKYGGYTKWGEVIVRSRQNRGN